MSKGASVGIFGPWGSGKTSFVNLARAVFDSEGVPCSISTVALQRHRGTSWAILCGAFRGAKTA